MRISLVGLPGSGKSSVGRELAKRIGLGFVDSDQALEAYFGCSVRAYFERHGEPLFRLAESGTIEELTALPDVVLSTGGGSVVSASVRARLKLQSTVIYLHSSPEDVYRRLRRDQTRPLLQVADPLQRLQELYLERDPLYREIANVVIETGRPTVAYVVNQIIAQLDMRL